MMLFAAAVVRSCAAERTPLWFELSLIFAGGARMCASIKATLSNAVAIFGVEKTSIFVIDATPVALGIIAECQY